MPLLAGCSISCDFTTALADTPRATVFTPKCCAGLSHRVKKLLTRTRDRDVQQDHQLLLRLPTLQTNFRTLHSCNLRKLKQRVLGHDRSWCRDADGLLFALRQELLAKSQRSRRRLTQSDVQHHKQLQQWLEHAWRGDAGGYQEGAEQYESILDD
ncbi:hypothetical protein LTR17_008378 [Elasticomyces elasticus]|nr:hypothetical protein LTR17_008378 [Elasticomyces elasticus]